MNTKNWGPGAWEFLHAITFNYPTKIDARKKDDRDLRDHYKVLFLNLQYTLPCKYCRLSFKEFMEEIPIDKFLDSRESLTHWLYLIHDRVNKKLIKQEASAKKEKRRLLDTDFKEGKMTLGKYNQEIANLDNNFKTIPTPSFRQVCKKYEEWRADCAKKPGEVPTCRGPAL